MKRNLLSIIILALLVVNIVMTAVMMFTIVPANKKTISLVGDIASAMKLELSDPTMSESESTQAVSVADTATYNIEDKMTISLKKGSDEADHYAVVSVSLCMNTKDADYKTYGTDEDLASKESMIKNEIIDAIGSLSYDEAQVMSTTDIQDAVLQKIQAMYNSQFIYKVAFRDIMFQ